MIQQTDHSRQEKSEFDYHESITHHHSSINRPAFPRRSSIGRGGPRLVDGVEAIASLAHPEIFGEYDSGETSASSPGFSIIPLLGALAVLLVRRT